MEESFTDSEHTSGNSARNTVSPDVASGMMGILHNEMVRYSADLERAKSCSEKNGVLTLLFHPSTNVPRGSCFKIARVVAYSSPKAHIEQSMKTRAIALRERSLLHVRSRVARATRHIKHITDNMAKSSSTTTRKLSAVGFPNVLDETFAAITVYTRLEQAASKHPRHQ